jgi:hypothetical protein
VAVQVTVVEDDARRLGLKRCGLDERDEIRIRTGLPQPGYSKPGAHDQCEQD